MTEKDLDKILANVLGRTGMKDAFASDQTPSQTNPVEQATEQRAKGGKKKKNRFESHPKDPSSKDEGNATENSAKISAPVHVRKGKGNRKNGANKPPFPNPASQPKQNEGKAHAEKPSGVPVQKANEGRPKPAGKHGKGDKAGKVLPLQKAAESSPQKKKAGAVLSQKKPTKQGLLRVIPLGGLGEIGKNMTLLETAKDIIIVDCGMGFPDEDMPGVDLVIPDFSYLERNKDKVRGVFLTHGHEDHIGSVPYLLRHMNVAVYGTRLTLGILKKKLEEFRYEEKPHLVTVEAGDTVSAGSDFTVEFIHVNHSIADSCALAIDTPVGKVVHSGDFKLDVSPIGEQMMDIHRFGELGKEGVTLLLCESTNVERQGFTPSERSVGESLEHIFMKNKEKRLVIATFSSNVHRVQQIIDVSVRHGRRVAVLGRSMVGVLSAARELGYMDIPEGTLIEVGEISRFKNSQLTLITTGSQGEPMSALSRMAQGEHERIKLSSEDVVVLSSSAIPGNEKLVGKTVNALVKSGITVINDSNMQVHASGHACSEEIKLLHALIKPKYLLPVHGEARHLYAHKALAEYMGMAPNRIFVTTELGRVLELKGENARFAEQVSAGAILVDGAGVGDVGTVVLRERKQLAEDGLVVVAVTVDRMSQNLLSPPDILSSGFVYIKDSGALMGEANALTTRVLEKELSRARADIRDIKARVTEELSRFFFKKTKRRPMVMVVITEF